VTENADLLYAGRDRKRPPGASDLVRQIWLLLRDHPEGMTRDDIHTELAEGWLDTDAYRAYDHLYQGPRPTNGRRPEYGSELFKERAQKWAISKSLGAMKRLHTAKRSDGLWFAGRPPRVTKTPDRTAYVPLTHIIDSQAHANRAQVARENLKAICRAALEDKRNSKGHRTLAQEVLDYLTGNVS
jgi:hypothetical protein